MSFPSRYKPRKLGLKLSAQHKDYNNTLQLFIKWTQKLTPLQKCSYSLRETFHHKHKTFVLQCPSCKCHVEWSSFDPHNYLDSLDTLCKPFCFLRENSSACSLPETVISEFFFTPQIFRKCSNAQFSSKDTRRIACSALTLDLLLSICFVYKICWSLVGILFAVFFFVVLMIFNVWPTQLRDLFNVHLPKHRNLQGSYQCIWFRGVKGTVITGEHPVTRILPFYFYYSLQFSRKINFDTPIKCLFSKAFYESYIVLIRWWPTDEQLGYWQPGGKFVQSEMTSATAVESQYIIWHLIITYSGYSKRIWSNSSYCNNLNDRYAESSKHASSQTYLDGKCMILQGKQIGTRLDKGGEKRLGVISLPQPLCILNFLAVFTEPDTI